MSVPTLGLLSQAVALLDSVCNCTVTRACVKVVMLMTDDVAGVPTAGPTLMPTFNPSFVPTNTPTLTPTQTPIADPTLLPSLMPTHTNALDSAYANCGKEF